MPFFAAQIADDDGGLRQRETGPDDMGDRSVTIEAPASITISGILACVASGAAASAAGVMPSRR